MLLSTDSSRAFAQRVELARRLGGSAVYAFNFSRAKYGHTATGTDRDFVEHRLRASRLDAGDLLAEALLDLWMLSQADVLIGSLYSNFARLALSLAHVTRHGDAARHLSFDAMWCPYHECQAGCDDVDRLCAAPRLVAEAELNSGSRGSFESGGGVRPRRVAVHAPDMLLNLTHPARRPWVRLMSELMTLNNRSQAATGAPHNERAACRQAFAAANGELQQMPAVY